MAPIATIQPFVTGDYLAPPTSRRPGERVVAVAYLVRHRDAMLLFDTGFPFDEPFTVEEGTDPIPTFPRSLGEELARLGTSTAQLDLVVNCHLHIDHAGGNHRLLPDLPIYAQATELEEARREEEQLVVDALGIEQHDYRPVDGAQELLPGIRTFRTPGHTSGHQSLVVETQNGPVVLLGQGMPSASDFASAAYAVRLRDEGSEPVPPFPDWLPDLLAMEPIRVHFAHDLAVWQPSP